MVVENSGTEKAPPPEDAGMTPALKVVLVEVFRLQEEVSILKNILAGVLTGEVKPGDYVHEKEEKTVVKKPAPEGEQN